MNLGIIGAGAIGSHIAQAAIAHGHTVVIANSRGPETLTDLVAKLGSAATAATAEDAAKAGEVVVVTIPLKAIDDVPVAPLAGKVVIDTNNYYPGRDGQIAALDDDSTTSSELLAAHLPASHVVKAFNQIMAADIVADGSPEGTSGRRALAIAGDDADAKARVAAFIAEIGFDVVDAGPLAEGRRYQPGTASYGPRMDIPQLRRALGLA